MYFILFPSCFFPLSSPFHLHPKAPPVARFMSSGRLSGRQRRMMGKWVFGWPLHSLWGPPLSIAPVSSSTSALAWEKVSRAPRGRPPGWSCRTWTRATPCAWACECVTMETGRATDASRSQSLSCLLPPSPHTSPAPPPPLPHLTLRHQVATCCRSALEPASSAACSVNLRV